MALTAFSVLISQIRAVPSYNRPEKIFTILGVQHIQGKKGPPNRAGRADPWLSRMSLQGIDQIIMSFQLRSHLHFGEGEGGGWTSSQAGLLLHFHVGLDPFFCLGIFFGWDHPLLLLPAACGIFQDRRDVEKWGWGTCQVHHGDLIGTVFSFLFFSTLTGSDVPRH